MKTPAGTGNREKAKLQSKARKKYLSSVLARALIQVDKTDKGYWRALKCCSELEVDNQQKLMSRYYCRCRWCQTCQSIKMATMINKYRSVFAQLQLNDDLFFVTLTLPTIRGIDIPVRLFFMQKSWRKIADLARKTQSEFTGIRKLELKVSAGNKSLYHAHYHLIVVGESNAQFIVENWLRITGISRRVSQDYRRVNDLDNGLLEIMKYTSKLTCSDGRDSEMITPAWQLNVIFKALKGKRIYQGFGNLRAIPEDDMDITPEIITKAQGVYQWAGSDWYHKQYGQSLSDWKPTIDELSLENWDRGKPIAFNQD